MSFKTVSIKRQFHESVVILTRAEAEALALLLEQGQVIGVPLPQELISRSVGNQDRFTRKCQDISDALREGNSE